MKKIDNDDVVSIVIKALNEEANIERCIKSALKSLGKKKGEIILVDSLSTDNTIEIARKFPIKIIQLKDPSMRSCGIGPQLGYLYSKGNYIFILDADMELSENFIDIGIKVLKSDPLLSGVGGIIKEGMVDNLVFSRRAERNRLQSKHHFNKSLNMGGLYKRSAIDAVGYLSNPNLHSYEEFDLGTKLLSRGFLLKRIESPMVTHYGKNKKSLQILLDRWKSKYLHGSGELIRNNLSSGTLVMVLREIKLYILVLLWWLILVSNIFLIIFSWKPLIFQLTLTMLFILFFTLIKHNVFEVAFSLVSWSLTSFGLLIGFFSTKKELNLRNQIKIIK